MHNTSVCDATNNIYFSHIITPNFYIELLNLAQYTYVERPGALVFVSRHRQVFCPSPKRSGQPPPPSSLLTTRTDGFSLRQNGRGVKVTTCLHPVPRSRMCVELYAHNLCVSTLYSLIKHTDKRTSVPNVYWTVHHCNSWRMKDQLDVTCYFISFLMYSTCFGH